MVQRALTITHRQTHTHLYPWFIFCIDETHHKQFTIIVSVASLFKMRANTPIHITQSQGIHRSKLDERQSLSHKIPLWLQKKKIMATLFFVYKYKFDNNLVILYSFGRFRISYVSNRVIQHFRRNLDGLSISILLNITENEVEKKLRQYH